LGLPANLLDAAAQEGRSDWLRNLPEVVAVVERIWSVHVGEPFQPGGQTAWVAPASGTDHDLVVKIAWRHPEAAHEADGLRIWDGNGAVRLHAVEEIDGSTLALLLERCRPGTTLETLPEPEQDLIIAGLLHRLWRQPPADGPFRPLQSMCDLWAAQFERTLRGPPSSIATWPGPESRCFASCRRVPPTRRFCAPTYTPATCSRPSANHG
jgi:streptomycin 6-kinase